MTKMSKLFWQSPLEDMKSGYTQDQDYYTCLLCGHKAEKGRIFPVDGVYYDAERYMRNHITRTHGSVFDFLIGLDKKLTGLSEHQNKLLRSFRAGKSDAEVQKEMGIGSSSTIRNHRFVLREKERQARIFLVLMELLKEGDNRSTTKKDAGVANNEDEDQKILAKFFPEGLNGPLKTLQMKEKNRLAVLREIAGRFEAERVYSEKEVNAVLAAVHEDFSTLRRYLIDYEFMERTADGSQYRLIEREEDMERKKELKQQYAEMKIEGGVYQIRNTINHKLLVMATPNFKTMNGRRMELRGGGFKNQALQDEWKQYGEDAFVFEILETLEEKDDPYFDKRRALSKLEAEWLERLQPYEERGYNRKKNK